jgi:hypothetical protein
MKTQSTAVDNFEGWNDGVEGVERPQSAGLIQGTLLKFSNTGQWVTRDEDEIASDLELIAVDLQRVVQKWQDGQPVETRILEPGENFPDLEALNADVPQSEWVEGPDGKKRGPWQAQHILYLLDPATMDRFTYPTGTTGGKIAIGDLRDKTIWMRRTRGPNVFPIVTLSDVHMNTRFGGPQRPAFKIVKWTRLGGEGGEEVAALPAPTSAPPASVTEPTLAEDFNDDLPGDLAPPKKPAAKSNGKRASKSEAA